MAEVKPAEVSAILKQQLTGFQASASLDEVGTVLTVGDGIARVYGLTNVQYGELVAFENGMEGIVLNLEEDNVGAVLMGSSTDIKEGDKVLVHAGSGGVGTVAIQIAKHFGAFVATTTSGKNADLVKELGADLVIDYTTQKFEDELSDYDLVIDTIGGETLARSFEVLKKGGTMVSVKSQDNDNLAEKYGVHFEWFFMSPDGKMLAELAKLISQGTVKTVIDSIFRMNQAAEAFDRLATGRAKGKIVIAVK